MAWTLASALAALGVACVAGLAPASTVVVEDWSEQTLGHSGIPVGWEGQSRGRATYDFRIEAREGDGAHKVLHLLSDRENSIIAKRVGKIDVQKHPILEWEWRVVKLPTGGDSRKAATDDQAGQIYVVFPRFPAAIRSRIIGYVWDSTVPAGESFESARTGMLTYVVVRSGSTDSGRWIRERRDVLEDFERIYGEEPVEAVEVVCIGIDSNDTTSRAESYMGPIRFLPR